MKISMISVAIATLMARKMMLQNISFACSFHLFQLNDTSDQQFVTPPIDSIMESPRNEFFEDTLPSMTIPQKRPTNMEEFINSPPQAHQHNDAYIGSSCSNTEGGKEARIPNVTFKDSDDVLIQSKIQIFSNVMNQFKEGLMEENEAREISEKLGLSWDNFIGFFRALELHKTGVIDENEFRDTSARLGFGLNK